MADFLATCITARRNVLVCGGPGSGKTTVVAALAAASPAGERVVSIEEVAELAIGRDEWIAARDARRRRQAAARSTSPTLLETALRLMPDRLVVGEVRGREAMPLVQALNSSVDGAVVAMTGEGANAALNRLATLARATQRWARDARDPRARRAGVRDRRPRRRATPRATSASTRSRRSSASRDDDVRDRRSCSSSRTARFAASGTVPRFYTELEARGIPADQAVFR